MKIVVSYLNFVFQFIKNMKWHFGYTDCYIMLRYVYFILIIFYFGSTHDYYDILWTKSKNYIKQ